MNQTTLVLLFFSLLLSSCMPLTKGIVTFPQEPDDIFTKESLNTYLKENPNPKIVLRVSRPAHNISFTGQSTALRPTLFNAQTEMYNTIEKELLKAGFEVRDRKLFEEVASKNATTDYAKIKDLTDTDLILELVSLNTNIEYRTNTFESYTKRKEKRLSQGDIYLLGALVEFKVIIVNTNEVAGSFEFNFSPCSDGCGFFVSQIGGLYRGNSVYSLPVPPYEMVESGALMDFIEVATQELIKNLR